MRSRELALETYRTDKITGRYLDWYDPILAPFVDREVRLLEIGVHEGGSLLLWRDYFPRGMITGIDLKVPAPLAGEPRIQMFEGSQADPAFLSEVARQAAPEGFDIIIDDASHLASLTRISFWHLFENHLKPKGLFVIEDWGTGYWDGWNDGKPYRPRSRFAATLLDLAVALRLRRAVPSDNHPYGMVGFIKELVDEQGAADLTRASFEGRPARESRFDSMIIRPSVVFVCKQG